jgi:hypothetical protein
MAYEPTADAMHDAGALLNFDSLQRWWGEAFGNPDLKSPMRIAVAGPSGRHPAASARLGSLCQHSTEIKARFHRERKSKLARRERNRGSA